MLHDGACHRENWGGYCTCGGYVKKNPSVLPRRVKLGKNFIVDCRLVKPKGSGPKRYMFSIHPVVPKGKKYRSYSTLAFPGSVKVNFVEVL
jgi:hypothetical protein